LYSTAEFRKNLKIEVEGIPFVIVECQHIKPGKGSAFVRTRMKNLINGKVLERNFKSGETVDTPNLEMKSMSFMYKDESDNYHFMDSNTYEQIFIPGDTLGETKGFILENMAAEVLFYNGKPIGIEIPIFGNYAVVKTDPGFKGDTVQGGTKPATLETGAVIQVPLFVLERDIVKVDTRTGDYIERVGKK
jgi:elongation factor P